MARADGFTPLARFVVLAIAAMLSAACTSEVQGGVTERDANELVVVLRGEGVAASKVVSSEGWSIRVPSAQTERSLSVMVDYGLPRRATQYAEMLEASGGIVPSAEVEQARRAALIEASLEETLLSMSGVHDAFVHAVIPGPQPGVAPREAPAQPRLSIVLVERGEGSPPDEAVRAIAMGAVRGLEEGDVAIVRTRLRLPDLDGPTLAQVGPLVVAGESVVTARAVLGGLGLAVIVLSGAVLFLLVRKR